jgi:hypothetical protein
MAGFLYNIEIAGLFRLVSDSLPGNKDDGGNSNRRLQ